ncbi:hypothetical protein OQA88_6416 [Cercophora sp. LCS_1]
MGFKVLKSAIIEGSAARLGRLALAGRRSIETPNFFAVTSRGVVPHVTPDNVNKHVHAGGTYVALEDFIERPQKDLKRPPPIYNAPTTQQRPRALHSFTAMSPSIVTILGARRIPAVPSPMGNKNAAISVCTSTGFQVLTTKDYHSAISTLRPDIAIPLADLSHTSITPNSKRALRMAERTDDWLKAYSTDLDQCPSPLGIATFAPIPPVSYSIQWEYISRLSEDLVPSQTLAGLALYDPSLLPDMLTDYPNLSPLPRLSLSAPTTPQRILGEIALGADAFVLPSINTISDAGIALNFTFPAPDASSVPLQNGTRLLPLGSDLSSPTYKFSTAPLSENCQCYACKRHSAAYVHHLLSAREMLGWTLLQMHNHAVMDAFFAGVRNALAQGQAAFEEGLRGFNLVYEPEFPAGTGERPRARGYQYKSEGGDAKLNRPAWEKFDTDKKEEVGVQNEEPGVQVGGGQNEGVETPLVLDEVEGGGKELGKKGFGGAVRG